MRRPITTDLLLASLLVLTGVGLRMAFINIPNFAPVAAIALLGGYALKSRTLAMIVPLSIMFLTDLMVGSHEPMIMLSVYVALAAPALLGSPLRRIARLERFSSLNTWKGVATLTGSALGSSCLFFLVTNLACWKFSGWYEQSLAGLTGCYASALPFFRFTFAGDVAFTIAFFAAYAACHSWAHLTSRQPVTV